MMNDNTVLTFGKHKFKRLSSVPAKYLLDLYYSKSHKAENAEWMELFEYLENNLEKIKARYEGKIIIYKPKKVCEKFTYPSEKDAKYSLKQIRETDQSHKKPVRAYECEKCSGWHLTSIPFESWKQQKDKEK